MNTKRLTLGKHMDVAQWHG